MAVTLRTADTADYVWQGDPDVPGDGGEMVPYEPGAHSGATVYRVRPLSNRECFLASDELTTGEIQIIAAARDSGDTPPLAALYRVALASVARGCVAVDGETMGGVDGMCRYFDERAPRELTWSLNALINVLSVPDEAESPFRREVADVSGDPEGSVSAEV